ncbi:Helicase conserved C-terminal domain [Ceratobasidium sp. AG-Ba]|nr:Helicase conserved C-terminal domain [Ceratobasidium sp. AG-Ba]
MFEIELRTEDDILLMKKTIIYVDNIAQGYRLTLYLRSLLPQNLRHLGSKIIRHIHASTCSKCKEEALAEFSRTDRLSLLRYIVASEAFGSGVDVGDIFRVINLGTPRDANSALQRGGRAGRKIPKGELIVYVNARTWDGVQQHLGLLDRRNSKRAKTQDSDSSENKISICSYFRRLLEAHMKRNCLIQTIQDIYGDDVQQQRCQMCSGCITDTPPQPTILRDEVGSSRPSRRRHDGALKIRRSAHRGPGRMTKEITAKAQALLLELVTDLWLCTPATSATQFEGPDAYMSAEKQSLLVKHIRDLETPDQVRCVLGTDWPYWETHQDQLNAEIQQIRRSVVQDLQANYLKRQAELQKKTSSQLARGPDSEYNSESDVTSAGSDSSDSESIDVPLADIMQATEPCEHSETHQSERLIIRLPARSKASQLVDTTSTQH